ncbi:hypothetical protein D3C77_742420 [compost metagenome]
MAAQRHLGEHAVLQADLLAIHQHRVAADHPLLFQLLDAPPAGRGRQADPLGELLHGLPGIALQLAEQLAGEFVEHFILR